MGGGYDYRYDSECSRIAARCVPQVDQIETLIKKFYTDHDRKQLLSAYKLYMKDNDKGFIKKVAEVGGCKIPPPKEFSDYEIEAKLELTIDNMNGKESVNLAEIMDTFEFIPSPTARYLKDASNRESTGLNHFFGTDDGEERIVIIHKMNKWYLKEKGPKEPYNYGIPGEEFVMKRKESRRETDPLEVAKVMAQQYADGKTSYQGQLLKNRAEAHLLQTISGRIYSLTVDELLREDKKRMVQFEIEYAGYIPKFKAKTNDEKAIVEDIIGVIKQLVFLYNDIELSGKQRLLMKPTQERKFDFVSAKEKGPALLPAGRR